jgi:HTH-type transcriptional regulator, competence development regulator
MAITDLGRHLRTVRELKELSLKDVAESADISTAYLQKLERGQVATPSPHKLHDLAAALDISYAHLMELAGYVVPKKQEPDAAVSILAQALNSEGLTEAELEDLASYLAWRRQRRAQEGK